MVRCGSRIDRGLVTRVPKNTETHSEAYKGLESE